MILLQKLTDSEALFWDTEIHETPLEVRIQWDTDSFEAMGGVF